MGSWDVTPEEWRRMFLEGRIPYDPDIPELDPTWRAKWRQDKVVGPQQQAIPMTPQIDPALLMFLARLMGYQEGI